MRLAVVIPQDQRSFVPSYRSATVSDLHGIPRFLRVRDTKAAQKSSQCRPKTLAPGKCSYCRNAAGVSSHAAGFVGVTTRSRKGRSLQRQTERRRRKGRQIEPCRAPGAYRKACMQYAAARPNCRGARHIRASADPAGKAKKVRQAESLGAGPLPGTAAHETKCKLSAIRSCAFQLFLVAFPPLSEGNLFGGKEIWQVRKPGTTMK